MASNPVMPPSLHWTPRSLSRPWTLVLMGLAIVVVGLLVGLGSAPAKAIFLVAGLIVAGFGVSRRLQNASMEFEERVESAGLIALAAFIALVAYLGVDSSWSSPRLFLGVLIGVALAGAVLVMMPPRGRRFAISLWILFHFTGILTAVTSIGMPGGRIPWLPNQLQVRVFHDYLEFNYLINAYHFYSPEPGPPTLLWFRVRYTDGTARWIKTPRREDHSLGVNFQRMLALTENVAHQGAILQREQLETRYRLTGRLMSSLSEEGVPQAVLDKLKPIQGSVYDRREYFVKDLGRRLAPQELEQYQDRLVKAAEQLPWDQIVGEKYVHDPFDEVWRRRQLAFNGSKYYNDGKPIPLALIDMVSPMQQYQPPTYASTLVLASYARHVAHTSPHPINPDARVKSVKIYRITHNLIPPLQFADGVSPRHPVFYQPYYMGEYSPEGKLLDPKEPLLYWLLPIGFTSVPIERKKPAAEGVEQVRINTLPDYPQAQANWINCLMIHSGDFTDPDLEVKSLESAKP